MVIEYQAAKVVDMSLLEWIYNEDNRERIDLYEENENYYRGETEIKIPLELRKFIEKEFGFRGNVCKAVVDAAVGFLSQEPLSIEIELPRDVDPKGYSEDRDHAEEFIYDVFRESNLLIKNFLKMLRVQGKKGEFALKAYPVVDDPEGGEVQGYKISVLRPEICFPKWSDEEYEEMEMFAIKYIRVSPETGKKERFAQVLYPGYVEEYVRPLDGGEWRKLQEYNTGYDFIPVVWVRNKEDDGPWAEADITADLKDVQDMFNKSLTDLAYNMDYESFRTAFLLGAEPPKDPRTGEPIEIETGPGRFHWIPGKGDKMPQLGELAPSDFDGMLKVVDKVLDLVSVISKTPKNELSRTGGSSVPTGVALRTVYQPFIGKTDEKANLIKTGLEETARNIFKMAEADNFDAGFEFMEYNPTIRISRGLPADEHEKAQIHEIEYRNGWKSRETIMQERGIEDVESEKEKIDQEAEEAAAFAGGEGRIEEELAALDLEDEPEI